MKLKLFLSIPVLLYLIVAIFYTVEKPVYITYTIENKTGMDFERLEYNTGMLQSSNPTLKMDSLTKTSDNTYTFKQKVIFRRKPLLFLKSIRNEPKLLMLLMVEGKNFESLKGKWAYKALQNKKYHYELLKSDIIQETLKKG